MLLTILPAWQQMEFLFFAFFFVFFYLYSCCICILLQTSHKMNEEQKPINEQRGLKRSVRFLSNTILFYSSLCVKQTDATFPNVLTVKVALHRRTSPQFDDRTFNSNLNHCCNFPIFYSYFRIIVIVYLHLSPLLTLWK